MESSSKKTRYPTRTELDSLSDERKYEQLEKRLHDKNVVNMMLDIKERRVPHHERFPYDISHKIALYMDVRDVLTMSCTTSLFALFVIDDSFWKTRTELDFPFVKFFDPTVVIGIGKYQTQPWRRYYNFVHYILHRHFYPRVPKYLEDLDTNKRWEMFRLQVIYNKEKLLFDCVTIENQTNKQIGKSRFFTFVDLLTFFNCSFEAFFSAKTHSRHIRKCLLDFLEEPNNRLDTIVSQTFGDHKSYYASPRKVLEMGRLSMDHQQTILY